MTDYKKMVLLINTGSGKNLGDRAMLINFVSSLRTLGKINIYTPHSFPYQFSNEFNTIPYTTLYSCLGRLTSVKVLKAIGVELFELSLSLFYSLFLCVLEKKKLMPASWKHGEANLVRSLYRSDIVVLTGGGYLTDLGKLEARSCLCTALLAIFLKKPVYLTGQGIGPINSLLTKALLSFVTKRARKILVRDTYASKNLLLNLGVESNSIVCCGDDALTLPVLKVDSQTNFKDKVLGVHLRLTPFGTASQTLIDAVVLLLKPLEEQGWRFRFYKFAEQITWEDNIYTDIIRNLSNDSYQVIAYEDPRKIKQSIGECTICIGVAYHFLLFALAASVPAIGLYSGPYYKQKLEGLFGWYGREKWLFNELECNSRNLLLLLRELDANMLENKYDLRQKTSLLCENYNKVFDQFILTQFK